jgi:hypothetical protein
MLRPGKGQVYRQVRDFGDELHLHIMRLLPVGRATTGMPRHPTPISDRGALQKVTT